MFAKVSLGKKAYISGVSMFLRTQIAIFTNVAVPTDSNEGNNVSGSISQARALKTD
jgi:hypothetical protein